MLTTYNTSELNTFKMTNTLLKDPYQSNIGSSFEEVLENRGKEVVKQTNEKASELLDDVKGTKKKKANENKNEGLPDIMKIIQNIDRRNSHDVQSKYLSFERLRENKRFKEDDPSRGARQQMLNNAHNFAGQALIEPAFDRGQNKRMTKSQLLSMWDKYAPMVSEDITKKSVRLDIPLLHDIQAVVLRMYPDRSISASLLGSKEMGELIKNNKDRLDRNLRHHHLSLREFNTYYSEIIFNSESGTKKKKKQAKSTKKAEVIDFV